MRGKLVGVSSAGDPLVSPTGGIPQGPSPVATPRPAAGFHVSVYYFLLLHRDVPWGGEEEAPDSGNGPSSKPRVGSAPKNHRGSGSAPSPSAASIFRPTSSTPYRSHHTSINNVDGDEDGVKNTAHPTYVVAIDNVTGQLLFTGTPNVDMFSCEHAALMSLPSKVSLAPEGVRVVTLCSFDAWCGCYMSDEFLHCMFVSECVAVPFRSTSPTRRSKTSAWDDDSDAPSPSWGDGAEGSTPTIRGRRSTHVHKVEKVFWKSIRLQCPQHVLTHQGIPAAAAASSNKPPSHRMDESRRSTGDLSTLSAEGVGVERPPEFPSDPHTVFPSSEQLIMTAYHAPSMSLDRKALYFSYDFDLTHAESTKHFMSGRAAVTSPKGGASKQFFLPSGFILKPDLRLIHTEHLWNVELIHYCELSRPGLGDFCARLMYGVVQGLSFSQQVAGQAPPGGVSVSPSLTPENEEENSSVMLVSRVSRVAYRQTLLELHRNPIRSAPLRESGAANSSSATPIASHHTSGGQQPPSATVSGKPPLEIHIPMECEIQLLIRSPAINNNKNLHCSSFVWFRGISNLGADGSASADSDAAQKHVALRQARERRHHTALQDFVLPPTSRSAGSPGKPAAAVAGHHGAGMATATGTFTPCMSPLTSPTPNKGRTNGSFWDAQVRLLFDPVDASSRPSESSLPNIKRECEHCNCLSPARHGLRRCGLTEEKQLSSALLTIFTWAVEAIAPCRVHQEELNVRSQIPSHKSLLYCLWLLLYREAAVQFCNPEHGGWHTTFSEALGYVRRLSSMQHARGPLAPWLPLDDTAIIQSLQGAAGHIHLQEQQQAQTFDHRYAGFLQALVELPRSTRLRNGPHRSVMLLSDPCGGATIVKASVTVQTSASSQGRAEALRKPLLGSDEGDLSRPSVPPRNDSSVFTTTTTSGGHPSSPLPTIGILETLLMPKSPPLNIPEGHEVITFTIALPQLSRITHLGVVVPSTLQDSMFASPLSITISCGEYLSPVLERLLLQDALLPLCVGNSCTHNSSLVLFQLSLPDIACDAEACAAAGFNEVPPHGRRLQHAHLGTAAASSGTSWLCLPPSESTSSSSVGRFVTVTIRASGKIATLLGNVMVFGHPLAKPDILLAPAAHSWIQNNSGSASGTKHAPSLTGFIGTPLTPEQEVRRLLLEEYHSLQSKTNDIIGNSTWSGRSRRNSSFALIDPSVLLKTFSLQTSDRLRVTEAHRSVLLGGHGIRPRRLEKWCGGGSRSPSEESTDAGSPLAARSPLHSTNNIPDKMFDERPLSRSPSASPRLVGALSTPFGIRSATTTPSILDADASSLGAKSPSGEEQFMLQLATLRGGGGSIQLCDAAALETVRVKLSLSRVARDRCCLRSGIPSWLLDFANHVQPRSLFFDIATSGGKKGKGSQCMRCNSKLSFLSKKKECYACGDTLCVKCTVPHPTALLELGLLDSTATVCHRCLERAQRVELAIGEFAKALNCVALVVGAHPGFRPQILTRRAWTTPTCGAKFLAQREVLGAPLVPPTNPQVALRHNLFLPAVLNKHTLKHNSPADHHSGGEEGANRVALEQKRSYNLCVGNAVIVVSNPRFLQPTAAMAAQTNITGMVVGGSPSPVRPRSDFVECVLGNAEPPGRGWRCMTPEEWCGGPWTATTQRSVVLLLPAHAEVDSIAFEFIQHKRMPSMGGPPQGDSPCEAPLTLPPHDADPTAAALGKPKPRRNPKDGGAFHVSVFVANSTDLFASPILEWTSPATNSRTNGSVVSVVVPQPPLPGGEASSVHEHEEAKNGLSPRRGRLVCVRLSGAAQDLCSLEILHVSLWGRYAMSGDACNLSATASRQLFPMLGEGSRGHSQVRYSLRHALPASADTPVHRHLSIMNQSMTSLSMVGAIGLGGGGSASVGATGGGAGAGGGASAHVNAVCAHLPHKARPLSVKAVQQMTACAASFVTEYDLGNAVTVCGVVVENYHPILCQHALRVATKLRFFGIGADGKRGNIAMLTLPVPLIPSGSHHDDATAEPLSMAFAFPSSAHNLRSVQVEAVEWIAGPQASIFAASGSGNSGGNPGTAGSAGGPSSSSGGGAPTTTNHHSSSSPQTWPFTGRLTFWTSPDAHTRRMVASGTYFSVFSSRDALSPSRPSSPTGSRK